MSTPGEGDDLDALRRAAAALESELAAHRVEVRETVAEALARSGEREQAVAGALDSLTAQLNQFTTTLAAEVRRAGDATVAQAVAELANAARAVEGSRVDAVAEAVARVDARVAQLATTVGPTLRELAAARLDDGLVEEVRRLRVRVEGLAGQAGAEPAADQAAAVEVLREQVGEVVGELRRAHDALGDELVEIGSGIRSAVRRDVEGIGAQLRDLAGAVDGLVAASSERANLPAALERALNALDALDMLALRPDPMPAIERLAAALGDGGAGRESGAPAALAGITRDELRAELDALQQALLDAPAPASPDDLERLHAEVAAIAEAVADRPPSAARVEPGLDELRAELAALRDAVRGLAAPPPAPPVDLEPLRQAIAALAARPVASGDDVAQLRAALDRLAERLPVAGEAPTASPAPDDDLRAALAAIAERLDAGVAPGPSVTVADLADLRAAIAVDLEVVAQRIDAAAAAASSTDLGATARDRTERLDAGVPAAPVDLSPVLDALARLADRPAPATAADLAPVLDAIDALASRPAPPATAAPVDLDPVVRAVEDVGRRVDALATAAVAPDLGDLHRQVDGLAASVAELAAGVARLASVPASGPDELHVDTLARQLDAIGRLVHHAVRSLHLVEAATVGAGPRTERDRAAAAAALDELRAVRARAEPPG